MTDEKNLSLRALCKGQSFRCIVMCEDFITPSMFTSHVHKAIVHEPPPTKNLVAAKGPLLASLQPVACADCISSVDTHSLAVSPWMLAAPTLLGHSAEKLFNELHTQRPPLIFLGFSPSLTMLGTLRFPDPEFAFTRKCSFLPFFQTVAFSHPVYFPFM